MHLDPVRSVVALQLHEHISAELARVLGRRDDRQLVFKQGLRNAECLQRDKPWSAMASQEVGAMDKIYHTYLALGHTCALSVTKLFHQGFIQEPYRKLLTEPFVVLVMTILSTIHQLQEPVASWVLGKEPKMGLEHMQRTVAAHAHTHCQVNQPSYQAHGDRVHLSRVPGLEGEGSLSTCQEVA